MSKYVVSLSGGLDSAVLMWHLFNKGHEVMALSVDYGQRHLKEISAAQVLCHIKGVPHKLVRLPILRELMLGSSQTSEEVAVPEGHYAEESMKKTVVPNRNMVLLSLAGAWAISNGCNGVAYAAHMGDHAIYPDCRPEFADAMQKAFDLCDWQQLELYRPFLRPLPMNKTDIVRLGAKLGVPFDKTWSCYKGELIHCGKCGTCVERREAFREAEVEDPTRYGQ